MKASEAGDLSLNVTSGNSNKVYPKKYDREEMKERIKEVPQYRRQTQHATAAAVGISQSTVSRMAREKTVNRVTTTLKPFLTEDQMLERVKYCAGMVDSSTRKFRSLRRLVHIDEKWFYITSDRR